jgi:hypothetical protein
MKIEIEIIEADKKLIEFLEIKNKKIYDVIVNKNFYCTATEKNIKNTNKLYPLYSCRFLEMYDYPSFSHFKNILKTKIKNQLKKGKKTK